MQVTFAFVLFISITTSKKFPSWEPDSNEVLCAKFLYFYEQRCFTPYIRKLEKKMFEYRGLKRLQVTCRGLTEALGGCLKFFNDKCSQDLLQTGQGSFSPTSLAPASRPALLNFRSNWIQKGGLNSGLDVMRCTVYGGKCEHPRQLFYCGHQPKLRISVILIVILSFLQIYFYEFY